MSWTPHDPYRTPGDHAVPGPQTGPVDLPPWSPPASPIPSYVPPQPHHQQLQPQDAPVPAPQQTRLRYADWGERVGASLVDYAILLGVVLLVGPLTAFSDDLDSLAGLAWLAAAGYLGWLNGSKGQSPGKALMGLKVVRDADGSTLGGPVGVVRAVMLAIMGGLTGGILFVLAVLWPAWDPRKQALHDKVVSATVVAGYPRARFGRQIFLP
ncbi:RDD family protein [Ornithinimicrobium cerasi]|uniref:RDD family protein n=1 Tax=Ornithinimicrobium cerasi TaxID=2248773 RepID=UPI000EFE0997|nr:RDD family protein [Ornithinimicrobium cerasi]